MTTHWDTVPDLSALQMVCLAAGEEPDQAQLQKEYVNHLYELAAEDYGSACSQAMMHFLEPSNEPPGHGVVPYGLFSVRLRNTFDSALDDPDAIPVSDWVESSRAEFAAQKFSRADISQWIDHRGIQSKYQFSPPREHAQAYSDDHLSARERGSFLKIILGVALTKYGYTRGAERNSAVARIVEDLDGLGIPVSDDKIRSVLREAASRFPTSEP
ncbi:hypothetical protein [Polaromonas sp.]|uniref:hypothetical protein n=1 Tax=Polaromonas sp. TaxID=1869339 RepID=UPI003BAB92C2